MAKKNSKTHSKCSSREQGQGVLKEKKKKSQVPSYLGSTYLFLSFFCDIFRFVVFLSSSCREMKETNERGGKSSTFL
jgi:hypothetical protein